MKRFIPILAGLLVAASVTAQSPAPPRFVQDRFVIGSWVEPPFDSKAEVRYQEMADAGFNTVLAGFSGADPKAFAAILRKHDLKALFWPRGTDPAEWPDGPEIWGYALQDEPNAAEFAKLGQRVAAIREKRPGKLSYINLFPDYATRAQLGTTNYDEHLERFIKEVNVDVLSMDHYPIFHPDRDGRDRYCGNLSAMRKHSQAAGIPFWNFFNTMPYGPHTDPTESQLRWQIYASLTYGAKGVLYFCYYTPQGAEFPKGGAIIARDDIPSRHYDQAKRLNAEVKHLGPTLMKLSSTGIYRVTPTNAPPEVLKGSGVVDLKRDAVDPPGDYLVGAFRHEDGRRAVLLMNYRFAYSAWPTVVFDSPPDKVREVDKQTGREIALRDESPDMPGQQLSLADAEGRLFLLPKSGDQ